MQKDDSTEKIFLNEKPADLLINLKDEDERNYASALSKDADVTYSHTVKCLQRMEQHGLVEFHRNGRKKEIELTTQGDEIAETLFELVMAITGEPEEDEDDSVIESESWS
ncbi:MAG: winged helix DNA-binding protein [Candidatus Nanohaloarchaea archaeon]